MERMTTPWLDAQKTMRSIAGFAELHGIGKAISNAKGFEDSLSAVLRRWSAPCTIRLTYRLCRQDCSLCDGVTNRRSYLSTKPGQLHPPVSSPSVSVLTCVVLVSLAFRHASRSPSSHFGFSSMVTDRERI